jgi:diguanylate cyclase (GGDEF)-like protein
MEPGTVPGTATRVISAGSGAEARAILADALPTLGYVHGVVRLPAWDLAVECVEEALASGTVPSLERLGRLGQLGSLPSFIAALEEGDDLEGLADDFARERESLGLAPVEIAAELLVLGRVLERHGEVGARAAVDRCLVGYVGRVTAELAESARRDPLTGLLNHRAFHAQLAVEAARARRFRGSLALVLFDLDRFKETNDREGHQEGDRLLRAFASALAATVRETDVAGRVGGDEFAALLLGAAAPDVDAFVSRLRRALPEGLAISAGAAHLPAECPAVEQLLETADRRLYSDKSARAA